MFVCWFILFDLKFLRVVLLPEFQEFPGASSDEKSSPVLHYFFTLPWP